MRPAAHGETEAVRLSWIPGLRAAYLEALTFGDPDKPGPSVVDPSLHFRNGLCHKDSVAAFLACPAVKRHSLLNSVTHATQDMWCRTFCTAPQPLLPVAYSGQGYQAVCQRLSLVSEDKAGH